MGVKRSLHVVDAGGSTGMPMAEALVYFQNRAPVPPPSSGSTASMSRNQVTGCAPAQ